MADVDGFDILGISVKMDPDLDPGVFWLTDDAGLPLGVGVVLT